MTETSEKDDLGALNNAALSELAQLGRVSHRLAMTEGGAALERVLSLLLPRLLNRIGSNHRRTAELARTRPASASSAADPASMEAVLRAAYDRVHAKLVEMLSHTMKRTRADSRCRIPCEAVLGLLLDAETGGALPPADVGPFTLNLSLAFLTLGLPRCPAGEVESLLPGLMMLVGAHSGDGGASSLRSPARRNQAHQCAHLVLRAVEAVVSGSRTWGGSASAPSQPPSSSLAGKKAVGVDEKPERNEYIASVREVCRDGATGAAVYDLLLDALLYQPTASSGGGSGGLPCPGLSQSGHERLRGGTSLSAKSWAAEHASQSRLRDMKLSLLEFVAPCRRWAPFQGDGDRGRDRGGDDGGGGGGDSSGGGEWGLGVARTVALLVATSGDPHPDVADRAASYLKAHLDSMRNVTSAEAGQGGPSDQSSTSLALLGDPVTLICALLLLVLGDNVAASILAQNSSAKAPASLGVPVPMPDSTTPPELRTVLLSTKRRMMADTASATVMTFVSSNILDDIPRIFVLPSGGGAEAAERDPVGSARSIGSLILAACSRHLESGGGADAVGGPRVASARLLNSLCVRLASFYDALADRAGDDRAGLSPIHDLLARSLALACAVLSASSSPHTARSGGRGGVETKDSSYGIVCALARSKFAMASGGALFNCGGRSASASASADASAASPSSVSIATAALLFGCAANEEETLRPRSVAALDALLAAYCRLYDYAQKSAEPTPTANSQMSNPWQQMSSAEQQHQAKPLQGLSRSLLPLLWSAAQTSQPKASRLAAARWSGELIKALDLPNACHILCFLAGDPDVTAASIAREGLGISSSIGEGDLADVSGASHEEGALPDFRDLIEAVFAKVESGPTAPSSWRPTYHDFSPLGRCTALRFGLICLLSDLYGGEDEPVDAYVSAITSTLSEFAGRGASSRGREATDLLDESSICLAGCLAASRFARAKVVSDRSSTFDRGALAGLALSANSSRARRHLAEACGSLYEDRAVWGGAPAGSLQPTDPDLASWAEHCGIGDSMSVCAGKLNAMQTNLFMAGEVHGAAYLGAACVRAFRLAASHMADASNGKEKIVSECWTSAGAIVSALGRGTLHSDEAIGNACSNGLSIAFSYDGEDAPQLEKALFPGAAGALVNLESALRKYGNGDHTDAARASSLTRAAGAVLAASTSGSGSDSDSASSTVADATMQRSVGLGQARLLCVNSLFALLGSTAFRKDNEISLIVGEALGSYADAYCPAGATWTSPQTERPKTFDEAYAAELPPHKHVLYVLLEKEIKASSPHKKTACAPALLALVGRAARTLHHNPETKRMFVSEILEHLVEFQTAFVSLLADPKSKQLSRESCCLGLAACRGLTITASSLRDNSDPGSVGDGQSRDLNERLLRAFGQTTKFAGSAYMESRAQNAERVRRENRDSGAVRAGGSATSMMEEFGMEGDIQETGGASGMGEAALGAYREMAGAAMSLGRPDTLYSLMLLSVTHPVWRTAGVKDRYSAASLLGKRSATGGVNMVEIQQSLRPHLGSLIPRLLRACHDPNKQTREQMSSLWLSLTGGGAESRSAITDHLLSTIDTLIDDATNKLWRARAGACGALSEVIVSRSWEELGGGDAVMDDDDLDRTSVGSKTSAGVRLLRLWRVTTRALDDVRLTVRESGQTLARSVRSLTVRLSDPSAVETPGETIYQDTSIRSATSAKKQVDAGAAAATALRWLVKYGLNQPCAEATGFCVSCLLGIVDVAQPSILQPVLPELIGSLSMAMSGLEPSALNYLQVRVSGEDAHNAGTNEVSRYDQLERLRLQLAQSGPIAGALTKCLSMVRFVTIDSQKRVIPQLDSALRCGAGFATRAAVADAISTLCSSCPLAFKFAGHSSTNPTVRLLRALYFASEREHGTAAKDKMAHALGSLAQLAPGHSVRVLAVRACERYSNATGSNDDPAARRAASAALRAIAVRASGQFADGGSNNIWCTKVLPLAFLGRKDEDAKVASLWKDVWEEGGTAANVGNSSGDFGVLLEEKLLPYLVLGCIEALSDVSWSRRVTACAALIELADIDVLSPAPRSVQRQDNVGTSAESLLRSRRRAQASTIALAACVRLIVKSRVWNGKAEVVKATAKLAGKWAGLGVIGSEDPSVWGWEPGEPGSEHHCLWVPVVQEIQSNQEDLFVGDRWFTANEGDDDGDIVEDQKEQTQPQQEDEAAEDKALDFGEGDVILGDDETPGSSNIINTNVDVRDRYDSVVFSGLCRALLEQGLPSATKSSFLGSDDTLPYRSAALQGLSNILQSLSGPDQNIQHARYIYRMLAPELIARIKPSNRMGLEKSNPPLIVARSIECLAAAMWQGMGEKSDCKDEEDTTMLANLFCESCGGKQPAWTVREASALAGASLALKSALVPLRKHETIGTLLECTIQTSKDRKFWRVRCAGLKLLRALVSRAGLPADHSFNASVKTRQLSYSDTSRQLMLEAILPHKEKILKLAKAGLSDPESQVTAVAAEICTTITWWP